MTTPKEAHLWRHEIQHGPEGEANYAWVYDALGEMVCTAKTYHAEAIVTRMNALASLQGEDAVERVKVLARRFWSIHPSTIATMNLTREEFYAREMTKLLATGLVPDEAAVRADEREKCASEVERRNWPNVGDARRVAAAIRSGGGE